MFKSTSDSFLYFVRMLCVKKHSSNESRSQVSNLIFGAIALG